MAPARALLQQLESDPFAKKFAKLNRALCGLVEDYSLVSFIPLAVQVGQDIADLVCVCVSQRVEWA